MIGMAIYAALGAVLVVVAVLRRPHGEFKLARQRERALATLARMHRPQ